MAMHAFDCQRRIKTFLCSFCFPTLKFKSREFAVLVRTAKWTTNTTIQCLKVVEGNHYFPLSSIRKEFFEPSSTTSMCPWKGTAKYYNVKVDGKVNRDSAWYYDSPKDAAKQIKDHVAFWKGVAVQ